MTISRFFCCFRTRVAPAHQTEEPRTHAVSGNPTVTNTPNSYTPDSTLQKPAAASNALFIRVWKGANPERSVTEGSNAPATLIASAAPLVSPSVLPNPYAIRARESILDPTSSAIVSARCNPESPLGSPRSTDSFADVAEDDEMTSRTLQVFIALHQTKKVKALMRRHAFHVPTDSPVLRNADPATQEAVRSLSQPTSAFSPRSKQPIRLPGRRTVTFGTVTALNEQKTSFQITSMQYEDTPPPGNTNQD